MVENSGIEPLTSCVQSRRSPSWAKAPQDLSKLNNTQTCFRLSLERRWSSRTFRYGYLVTTSPQSSPPPSTAGSLRLPHRLRVWMTFVVWRAVCTRPGNVFTAVCWPAITSDSCFMQAGCSLQSELGLCFWGLLRIAPSPPSIKSHCSTCVAQAIRGMMTWRHPRLPPHCLRQSLLSPRLNSLVTEDRGCARCGT